MRKIIRLHGYILFEYEYETRKTINIYGKIISAKYIDNTDIITHFNVEIVNNVLQFAKGSPVETEVIEIPNEKLDYALKINTIS